MNLACWITSIRIILAPFIFWQLSANTTNGLVWVCIFLTIAGISDLLDGWVARARHEVTELGKALDPVGDKLVIAATLLALISWGLPFWMVLIYILKEIIQVVAGFFMLKKVRQLIPANQWGKFSTFTFFVGFAVFFFWQHWIGAIILGIAVLLSFYALFTYYREYRKIKQ